MKKTTLFFSIILGCLFLVAEPIRSMLGSTGAEVASDLIPENPTAADYVQDGLVCMWDGVENAGWGIHDDNAMTWVDLSGNGHDLTVNFITGVGWYEDSFQTFVSTSAGGYNSAVGNEGLKFVSAEVCADTQREGVFMFSGMADRRFITIYPYFVQLVNPYCEGFSDESPFPSLKTVSGVITGTTTCQAYCNAIPLTRLAMQSNWQHANISASIAICGSARYKQYLWGGRIFNVRFYDRQLSQSEIAYNYAIDKVRFNLP